MQSQAKPEVRREHENERMSLQLINDTISRLARWAYWSLRIENYKETCERTSLIVNCNPLCKFYEGWIKLFSDKFSFLLTFNF